MEKYSKKEWLQWQLAETQNLLELSKDSELMSTSLSYRIEYIEEQIKELDKSIMNEEWEGRLQEVVSEDYDIEDLVGVCRIARRNGFVAGRESFQKQVATRIDLAQERIDSSQNAVVNQAIIDTLKSLIV